MPAHSQSPWLCRSLVLFELASVVGCAGAQPGIARPAPQRPGTFITADAIAASGAKTA